ncbi:MAG: alkaline phosphatase D family protein [Gammaproteobacteria bacterium]
MPTRRALLAAGMALALPGRLRAQTGFRRYPFTLGVASGEPLPDGVVLWTRLAPEPLAGGGMPMQPLAVRWEVASDGGMNRIVQAGEAIAPPELGHSVHVEVAGLEPGQDCRYRFTVGTERSQVGRTAPRPRAGLAGRAPALRRCRLSALRRRFYRLPPSCRRAFRFRFHYGDYIYEYRLRQPGEPGAPLARTHDADEAYTLVDYRNRYALYKLDPDLQRAHASAPFLMSYDDHEVDNNWANDIDQDNTDPALFLLRRAAAFQAYYEHMPLSRAMLLPGADLRLYRRLVFGDLLAVHVLDTRRFRTDQPCGDGGQARCPAAIDPRATMLGAEQERWLLEGLAASATRWNTLAQQVMMMQRDRDPDPQRGRYEMDKWDGYVAARQRLLNFFQERRIAPVVLAGDAHSHYAGNLLADFDAPDAPIVGAEFVGTSITSNGDGSDTRPDTPVLLAANPHIKFFNDQRGYLSIEVTPARWITHFRTVDYVSRPGAPLATRASFAVEAGVAGVKPA